MCGSVGEYVKEPPVKARQRSPAFTLEVYSRNATVGLAVSPAFSSDKTILMPNQVESLASHCLS